MSAAVSAQPYVNVLDPDFYVDPWDAYRWLRDDAPMFWDPVQKLWVVSRYDDILAIEKDGERYSSFFGSRPHIDQRADESMINMDEPEHQAQRNHVSRQFTPRAIELLADATQFPLIVLRFYEGDDRHDGNRQDHNYENDPFHLRTLV